MPIKVSKDAKIRNRYNQVPQLTQDTNGTVANSLLDTTNESQKVSYFPAGDHEAHINRRAQRHSKHKTEKKRSIKEVRPQAYRTAYFIKGNLIKSLMSTTPKYSSVEEPDMTF